MSKGNLIEDEDLLLHKINETVVHCKLCPRLSKYIREVGKTKTKMFMNQVYWARPVPTFGDPKAKLLVIGLAPAAHGGNRTGRVFTGDSSVVNILSRLQGRILSRLKRMSRLGIFSACLGKYFMHRRQFTSSFFREALFSSLGSF